MRVKSAREIINSLPEPQIGDIVFDITYDSGVLIEIDRSSHPYCYLVKYCNSKITTYYDAFELKAKRIR
jgi:hypothetical protein